jgi:hypothetical protein
MGGPLAGQTGVGGAFPDTRGVVGGKGREPTEGVGGTMGAGGVGARLPGKGGARGVGVDTGGGVLGSIASGGGFGLRVGTGDALPPGVTGGGRGFIALEGVESGASLTVRGGPGGGGRVGGALLARLFAGVGGAGASIGGPGGLGLRAGAGDLEREGEAPLLSKD